MNCDGELTVTLPCCDEELPILSREE